MSFLRRQQLASLRVGFKTLFRNAFSGVTPEWDKIATLVSSAHREETYGWLGDFPSLRKWIGDRHFRAMKEYKYSILNDPYEASFEVDRFDVEDDNLGQYTNRVQALGQAAARHPDELVFALLAAGTSKLCYDGQYFFDTDHPVGGDHASVTYSNYDATGGGDPWFVIDNSRPLKPLIHQVRTSPRLDQMTEATDEANFMSHTLRYGIEARYAVGFGFPEMAYCSLNTLDSTNFNAIVAAMMSRESENGTKLGLKPKLLICGPSRRAAARTLLKAQTLSTGGSNVNFEEVGLLVTPYLT